MNKNLEKIHGVMERMGMTVKIARANGEDIIGTQIGTEYGPINVVIRAHADAMVSIMVLNIAVADCPNERKQRMYKAVNIMNMAGLLYKFIINENGNKMSLIAQYDFIIAPTDLLWEATIMLALAITEDGFKKQKEMFNRALYSDTFIYDTTDSELDTEIDEFLKAKNAQNKTSKTYHSYKNNGTTNVKTKKPKNTDEINTTPQNSENISKQKSYNRDDVSRIMDKIVKMDSIKEMLKYMKTIQRDKVPDGLIDRLESRYDLVERPYGATPRVGIRLICEFYGLDYKNYMGKYD